MDSKKYKIKETVDIFISNEDNTDNVKLTFHVMTTRDRLEIKTNKNANLYKEEEMGEGMSQNFW